MAESRNSTTETELFVQLLLQSTSENGGEDDSAATYRNKRGEMKSKGSFRGKEKHRSNKKKSRELASEVSTLEIKQKLKRRLR